MATTITLEGLSKHYPGHGGGVTKAVDDVTLRIERGDLFFLLGPSGCGKTTLLRMIAGFIEPTSGRVRFDDRDMTNVSPNKRNTGMVFQSYALWPHMSVAENVAFGLRVRKVPQAERTERVHEALRMVRMDEYASRKPNQLSGGQQQRVSLARALVVRPDVLLLDEPLSNLDAKLRLEMRAEIRRICKEAGLTAVYVTHDQKEALSMADEVAVLTMGKVAQVGAPRGLYERPSSRFVADFLGETNFVKAEVVGETNGQLQLRTPAGALLSSAFDAAEISPGSEVTCSIRPESWRFANGAPDRPGATIKGTIVQSTYMGEVAQHLVELPGEVRIKVFELPPSHLGGGTGPHEERVTLAVAPKDVVVLQR